MVVPAAAAAVPAPAAAPASAAAPVIVVFGDSISAGYGIRVQYGWVALLAQKLRSEGYGFAVVNASISGETTAGGLARLPRTLDLHHPRIVVLELGGNDGLRGLPLAQSRSNLRQMIALSRAAGARVLLLGMQIPPNYGPRYTSLFQAMYRDLATAAHVALVPFLLQGVALQPTLMQQDRIHPNEPGQPLLLANVWPQLLPLLRAPASAPPAARRRGRG